MKDIRFIIILVVGCLSSCSDYLDVVPDKTQEISLMFERRETAIKALASCYHFLPELDGVYSNYSFASDEMTTPVAKSTPGVNIMRGKQNVAESILGYWTDYDGQGSLYKGIRYCNTFIENIDEVNDMTALEKTQWKAEAIFLKAYYHFLLMSQYGPIPIADVNLPIDAGVNEVRVKRSPVDEVVDYIVRTIDLAMVDLKDRITSTNDMGRIDQLIAKSIKSRVLLYAASPLFNGNALYYQDFKDKDGVQLVNTVYDAEKWKKAADAAKEAIVFAEKCGMKLYTYNGVIPSWDVEHYKEPQIKALYDYRYMMVDGWNSELIWGNSNPVSGGDWWKIQAAANIINQNVSSTEAAWQWAVPTFDQVEAYYTKNGLPIDQDITFKYDTRYECKGIVRDLDTLYAVRNQAIPYLHLGREPRFYASIAFDRGFYRTWGEKWSLLMRKGELHGRKGSSNDYTITGYLVKKLCHPSSEGSSYDKLIDYPWPIIRLAELYLNYAEAMNEYYGPSSDIYDALNVIRDRAYIPHVEDVWADESLTLNPGKHLTKDGLREIIQQERRIELAFEGNRNYDVRRWMQADKYFNGTVMGWMVDETDRNKFYNNNKGPVSVQQRSFITPRDYLHPIKYSEITVNSNLIQNPGW